MTSAVQPDGPDEAVKSAGALTTGGVLSSTSITCIAVLV